MTIRERFEKLQRYGHLDDADTGESWLTVGNEGSWLKRADVLALADELDAERTKMVHLPTVERLAKFLAGHLKMRFLSMSFAQEARRHAEVLLEWLPTVGSGSSDELAPASESTQRKVAEEMAAVTEEQATAFAVSCLDRESRLAILRQWCWHCGDPAPCNCMRDE